MLELLSLQELIFLTIPSKFLISVFTLHYAYNCLHGSYSDYIQVLIQVLIHGSYSDGIFYQYLLKEFVRFMYNRVGLYNFYINDFIHNFNQFSLLFDIKKF